ncbi:MAG: hypothetical protein K1W37_18890 [Lachnospiraceae bacterium]
MKHFSIWSNYYFTYAPLWKHKKTILPVSFCAGSAVCFDAYCRNDDYINDYR